MKLAGLAALSALALSACASAAPGQSFYERLEQKALTQIADACSGKTGAQYDRCAKDVRSDVLARSSASRLPGRDGRGNLGQGAVAENGSIGAGF